MPLIHLLLKVIAVQAELEGVGADRSRRCAETLCEPGDVRDQVIEAAELASYYFNFDIGLQLCLEHTLPEPSAENLHLGKLFPCEKIEDLFEKVP